MKTRKKNYPLFIEKIEEIDKEREKPSVERNRDKETKKKKKKIKNIIKDYIII